MAYGNLKQCLIQKALGVATSCALVLFTRSLASPIVNESKQSSTNYIQTSFGQCLAASDSRTTASLAKTHMMKLYKFSRHSCTSRTL
jgi:hypothetical protein